MKKYYLTLLLIVSGIFCGLLQSSLNLPVISFIAFSPVMYALCFAQGKTQLLTSFLKFFMPYYIIQLSFLCTVYQIVPLPKFFAVIVMGLAVIMLSLWECFLMFLPVYMIRWLRRKKFFDVFQIALLICLGEWLQENVVILHFPWSAVWLSVTDMPIFMQSANLFGCRAVSFLILSVNGFIALIFTADKKLMSFSAVSALIGISCFYGVYSMSHLEKLAENGDKIQVMSAQDNIEGEKKSEVTSLQSAKSYISILNDNFIKGTDLVVLPETAVSCDYDEEGEEFTLLRNFAVENGCNIVTGCFWDDGKDYNAVCGITAEGKTTLPYCKQVLVPFGEKMPFSFLFGTSTLSECSDKEKILPVQVGDISVGASICIESIYPDIVRRISKSGADLLCISTNDSWFGKSFARKQHFRHSIMRAVENGKYLMRAGNCGISAIISPSGEIISIKSDSTRGACDAEISLISERTLYTKFGNLFICLPVILVAIAITRRFTIQA